MGKIKLDFNAPLTLGFAFLSFVMVLLGQLTRGASTYLLCSTYASSWASPMTYLRLFTHVLGHADWSHYMGNMTLFFILCPMIEEKYGAKKILLLMAVTALVSGLIHNLFFPNTVLLGASGIVFMLIMLSSFTNAKEGKIPITFIFVLIFYIGQEILTGVTTKDNISQLTHIIGGVCGALGGMRFSSMDGEKTFDR